MTVPKGDIYHPQFVVKLFDEMAQTYGLMNLITSFGFCRRWRHQCVNALEYRPGSHVVDFMSGMGELTPRLAHLLDAQSRISALDLSSQMCQRARTNLTRLKIQPAISILQGDALQCPLPDQSADYIVSSFGLKTFSPDQQRQLARQVHRVLKPGGRFSFLEISVPTNPIIRLPYLFYLSTIIPLLGKLFLGNPDNYRLLGIYTRAFSNGQHPAQAFGEAGLDVTPRSYFLGCATGFIGQKPIL